MSLYNNNSNPSSHSPVSISRTSNSNNGGDEYADDFDVENTNELGQLYQSEDSKNRGYHSEPLRRSNPSSSNASSTSPPSVSPTPSISSTSSDQSYIASKLVRLKSRTSFVFFLFVLWISLIGLMVVFSPFFL
jgi:hypothetical protein